MQVKGEDLRYLCQYEVENFIIMKDEEKIELDHSNVLIIEYMTDYEFNHMALLKVSLRVDVRRKMWIIKHKREIKVKFTLNKFGRDLEVERRVTASEKCWDEEFGIYFNDEDEGIDQTLLEHRLELNDFNTSIEDTEEENYFESQHVLDVYLFNPKLLNASRTQFNRVWTQSTLQNKVGEMLTYTHHHKVLMSKFDNDEIYTELLAPSHPTYKELIFLDQYFGFYEKGTIIFYDIDTLYIINANGKVTAKREDEWAETVFLVPYFDASTPGDGMIRKEGEEIFYITITEADVNPQMFTIGNNVEMGADAKIITVDDTTIDVYEANQSYIDQRNETLVYAKKENKYAGELMKARMEENECVLYITGQNLDINAFTPNKTYRIIFDETSKYEKYSKNEYRIAYAHHALKNESYEHMISTHRIVLKRTDVIDDREYPYDQPNTIQELPNDHLENYGERFSRPTNRLVH